MLVERDVAIPMRDGVVLRADVFRPEGRAPVPAILSRTPYDRTLSLTPPAAIDPDRAIEAGFALVVQDVRGQHGSGGEFRPFMTEGRDGHDSIEWVAAQPWCDGAVGMAGRSYTAATQWLAAAERPPHLRAIVPVVTGSDYFDGWLYQGGAFQLGFNLFWVHLMTEPKARRRLDEQFRHLPLRTVPLAQESGAGAFYLEWLEHWTYDEHWQRLALRRRYDSVQVPALNVGGWYDLFLGGTLENFAGLRRDGGSARARAGTRLVVGPWAHGSTFGSYPDHSFASFAPGDRLDLDGLALAFLRRHLADGEMEDGEPAVRIFVMGENAWRTEPDWPLARARATRWYLHGGGVLSPEPPGDQPPDEYPYDPRDPAPTVGGPTSLPGRFMRTNSGPMDQRSVEARPDVLVYTSRPLESPLEVTGPLTARIHAATSARDADFVVKLCDVSEDGVSRILAEGVLRARFREGCDKPLPVEPDRVYEYAIDLVATSNVFLPGHRIRVSVTSSSFPRFDRNAGSGKPTGTDTEDDLRVARQRVFHDPARPSHVVLPVVPR